MGWPIRYTTCWVELGSSESDSDWAFFFFIALSSEGVEETDDPTPERKEACIIFIEWWIGIIPPAPIGAKFSRSYLFRGFRVIGDEIVLLRMIRLVAPRVQRVGGLRGPRLTKHRSASTFEGLSSVLFRKNESDLVEGARGLLLLDGMILTRSNIQRQRGWNTSVKCEANSP